MRNLLIKLYDLATAPLYRRLARDLTVQLQEISRSYVQQHERLTAKLLDELLRLHMRVDNQQATLDARHTAVTQSPLEEFSMGCDLSEEKIYELMIDAGNSFDVVDLCARHKIPVTTFFQLDAKYRGCNPESIKKVRMLEATNFELTQLLTQLIKENKEAKAGEVKAGKVENGNGRQ
jgi:hypothetical protein